jgi:hypothetical protein
MGLNWQTYVRAWSERRKHAEPKRCEKRLQQRFLLNGLVQLTHDEVLNMIKVVLSFRCYCGGSGGANSKSTPVQQTIADAGIVCVQGRLWEKSPQALEHLYFC